MNAGTVQEDLVAVLAHVHSERAEMAELRSFSVHDRRIAALYPPVFTDLPQGLSKLISTPEQMERFLQAVATDSVSHRLAMLEDRAPTSIYELLSEGTRGIPYAAAEAKALRALVTADQARTLRLQPQQIVNTSLLNAASILWLAANWIEVTKLQKASSANDVAEMTASLRASLDL